MPLRWVAGSAAHRFCRQGDRIGLGVKRSYLYSSLASNVEQPLDVTRTCWGIEFKVQ